jgi:hypothetical protein
LKPGPVTPESNRLFLKNIYCNWGFLRERNLINSRSFMQRPATGFLAPDTGASPSGKAAGFDPAMRWFESSRPCHYPRHIDTAHEPGT